MLAFNDPEKLTNIYGEALETAHKSLLTDVHSTSLPVWDSAPYRRHRIAAAWAGSALRKAGYDPVSFNGRWYYYLLGLPSVVAFRMIRLTGFVLRWTTGSQTYGNLQLTLAGKLYGTKK
ncbi:hypothetical protein DSECCO2_600880 [anaerobic digester metagenome]